MSENIQSENNLPPVNENNEERQYWKKEEEEILEEWADKAQCYEWMHHQTHAVYKKKNTYYTIPVIIISTLTGTANFAQERIPEDYMSMYVMIVGSLNIIAGILTTIYQYFKISELNEANRVAYLSWGKFYRDIKTELCKHPLDRSKPKELLKFSKSEYDRLIEISPPISNKTITLFNKKVAKKTSPDLRKPELCDVLIPTSSFDLSDAEREKLKNKEKCKNNVEEKKDVKLEKFIKTFMEMNNREPTEEELNSLFYSVYNTDRSQSVESSSSMTVSQI